MAQRGILKFTYTAEELIDPVKARIDYHDQVATWWEWQVENAQCGLVPGGDAMVRHCTRQAENHRQEAAGLSTWLRILQTAPSKAIELNWEDADYFGL